MPKARDPILEPHQGFIPSLILINVLINDQVYMDVK